MHRFQSYSAVALHEAGRHALISIPICIQVGRPSPWPGTPGGSEEMTQAYSEVRRGKRRSDNEGIHLKVNRYQWYFASSS
jgi:hypothetical protein